MEPPVLPPGMRNDLYTPEHQQQTPSSTKAQPGNSGAAWEELECGRFQFTTLLTGWEVKQFGENFWFHGLSWCPPHPPGARICCNIFSFGSSNWHPGEIPLVDPCGTFSKQAYLAVGIVADGYIWVFPVLFIPQTQNVNVNWFKLSSPFRLFNLNLNSFLNWVSHVVIFPSSKQMAALCFCCLLRKSEVLQV